MQINQFRWSEKTGWSGIQNAPVEADLVLIFSDNAFFQTVACYIQLHEMFPHAHIVGCSSSGNVLGVEISDNDMVATAVKFQNSKVLLASIDTELGQNARKIGIRLMDQLNTPELRHAIIIADGLLINGSELTNGLNQAGIPVTGGLAGDGTRFGKTWVMADSPAKTGRVAAIGFYGGITVKSGCSAGWKEFGADRIITKSTGNVVYEIDEEPALDLYKRYLFEQADELPASGLRFPLSIQATKSNKAVIRTLLAIDETARSLTFAGDMPQGHLCKLMHTNLDNLVESAGLAAMEAQPTGQTKTGLCLLVSCVGRRLIMGQLTEDELDIVQENLGDNTVITGFYSYGELASFGEDARCQLHNQTMTVTTLYE